MQAALEPQPLVDLGFHAQLVAFADFKVVCGDEASGAVATLVATKTQRVDRLGGALEQRRIVPHIGLGGGDGLQHTNLGLNHDEVGENENEGCSVLHHVVGLFRAELRRESPDVLVPSLAFLVHHGHGRHGKVFDHVAAGEVDDLVGALLVVEVVGVEAAALPLPVQAEDELVDEVAVVVTLQGVLRHHLPIAVVLGLLHARPHLQLPVGGEVDEGVEVLCDPA